MFKVRTTGKIRNGILELDDKASYFNEIRGFNGKVEVIIKEATKVRSNPQNSYYWAVIVPEVAKHFKQPNNIIHEWLKSRYNNSKSTAKLTPMEFSDYCDRIMGELGQECGIVFEDTF